MAASKVVLSMFFVAQVSTLVSGSAFLEAQVSKADVEQALLAELHSLAQGSRLLSIKEDLRPMFVALPKSERGKLEPPTVRLAIHRYFVQKHAWYIKGLHAGGQGNSSASEIMKDRAPAFIQSLFDQHMHGEGLGLHELAVFVATLSDLVHKEAVGDLHRIFGEMQLPTAGPLSREWSDSAIKTYLVTHIVGDAFADVDVKALLRRIAEVYPTWPDTYMWSRDLRQAHDLSQQSRHNPFAKREDTFDDTVAFVEDLGHRFGAFQQLECSVLKEQLLEMEQEGSGRVRLDRFYGGVLTEREDWPFTESTDYLRSLGALDETDPERPSVVIPNYLLSPANCLASSGFYAVCCTDECEAVWRHLEWEFAAPSAAPARIADVVSALPSATVDAPRNLSAALLTRLDEIAAFHGGHVPLHGRLFAQWLHHAYPRECPFPHVSGTTSPMTQDEFIGAYGWEALDATMEEVQRHHKAIKEDVLTSGGSSEALPWTAVEELIAEDGLKTRPGLTDYVSMRGFMAAAALVSFAVPMARATSAAAVDRSGKVEKYLV